jgi:hypothetical protein
MRIKDKTVYAKVKISDGIFKLDPFWVRITNLGKSKDPQFELVQDPCRGASNHGTSR